MNKVLGFDETTGVVFAQAGCILEDLQNYVAQYDFMMPLDLGAKGSCQIGGNLATNAGGIKFIKYNSMHANTMGLTTVTANGETLSDMASSYSGNRRNIGSGYDLKHLFIGAEGTLGFITECAILCYPQPKVKQVCLVGTNDY
mmetsp:Transcript_37979/g.36373  ORF Transcript_37979/g.36373 Transcript_37979/m.36373 type:complete len:143 (-) Transcript_37979:821-1249(-)|eukprot:CAMPEP_0170544096 /NCGR_PEP_ID=MMETSP0211-20121228/2982_1 /TAXON_ID=311385 /ORGANISM="Pseudokeronopsis sp., Strain OXSARD2" /LENGTH=142 /DNA_ID=CAMNT_0010847653 /DNA_START=631 /DNA_END=1059 /DNA_ORIENTATION=-